MRYALLLHNAEPSPGEVPDEAWREMERLFDEYGRALEQAGVLVAAEILESRTATVTVTRTDGSTQVQDGPFAATHEALAGVFLIDVADRDAAVGWAERHPGATYGTVEVRPVATAFVSGAWT